MRALTQSEARGTETNVYRGGMLAANRRVYAGARWKRTLNRGNGWASELCDSCGSHLLRH